jgi:hypothetical protein
MLDQDRAREVFMMRTMLLLVLVAVGPWSLAGDPVRIENPAEPRDGVVEAVFGEQWRAGGEDDEVFFGNVLQVLPAPAGGLYVLDSQLLTVFHFDAAGELLGTLGRKGDGPGELNNVNSIVNMPDGSLGIGQVLPGKVVQVAPDGTPVRSFRVTDPEAPDSGFVLYLDGVAQGEMLVAVGMRWRMDAPPAMVQEMFLRRYDLEGIAVADFLHKETAFDTGNFVFTEQGYDFVWTRFDLMPDGRVCFAPDRNRYEIMVCDSGGNPERLITRPYRSWKRTGTEKEEARRSMAAIAEHYGREVREVTVEETEADILALRVMNDGGIRVRTSRGDRNRPAGVLTTLDEFDPEGVFVRQLAVQAPGDPESDAIHLLADGRVVVVAGAVEAYRREQNTERDLEDDGAGIEVEVICFGAGSATQ